MSRLAPGCMILSFFLCAWGFHHCIQVGIRRDNKNPANLQETQLWVFMISELDLLQAMKLQELIKPPLSLIFQRNVLLFLFLSSF